MFIGLLVNHSDDNDTDNPFVQKTPRSVGIILISVSYWSNFRVESKYVNHFQFSTASEV